MVTYGCCEPLDDRLDYVKRIKNVRRISMSPWIKSKERAAEELGKDYIYWAKPNPAYLQESGWDPGIIKKEINDIINTCNKYDTPLELAMKDVSTVSNNPKHLWEWSKIMRDIVGY